MNPSSPLLRLLFIAIQLVASCVSRVFHESRVPGFERLGQHAQDVLIQHAKHLGHHIVVRATLIVGEHIDSLSQKRPVDSRHSCEVLSAEAVFQVNQPRQLALLLRGLEEILVAVRYKPRFHQRVERRFRSWIRRSQSAHPCLCRDSSPWRPGVVQEMLGLGDPRQSFHLPTATENSIGVREPGKLAPLHAS